MQRLMWILVALCYVYSELHLQHVYRPPWFTTVLCRYMMEYYDVFCVPWSDAIEIHSFVESKIHSLHDQTSSDLFFTGLREWRFTVFPLNEMICLEKH